MTAGLLSIVSYGAAAFVHLIRLAAVLAFVAGNLVLLHGARLALTAMMLLYGTEADLQTCRLRLTIEGEHRHAGDYG